MNKSFLAILEQKIWRGRDKSTALFEEKASFLEKTSLKDGNNPKKGYDLKKGKTSVNIFFQSQAENCF